MTYSKVLLLAVAVGVTLAGSACTKTAPACSTSDSSANTNCQQQIPSIALRPATLAITFTDSVFYDQNSASWMKISKDNLSGGIFGLTAPIYSNFLNFDLNTATTSALAATAQNSNPTQYTTASYNNIPYVELVAEDGVQYLFDYVKRDLNNTVVYEKNGAVPIVSGRAVLPLVNSMFDGQLYSTNTALGSRFIHSLTFAAQSKTAKGTITQTINFETSFQIPPTSFLVDYSGEMQTFNLKNRWSHYFSSTDYTPNTHMKFFAMKQIKSVSEQIPLDVKITFATPPTLSMDQEIFYELPFDFDVFSALHHVIPLRGSRFVSKVTTTTSNTDFNFNVQMNGQDMTLANGRDMIYPSLPQNTPWDFTFFYNFQTNPAYVSPTSTALLSPLKPICFEFANQTYKPILEEGAKATAISGNGFISICSPTANKKIAYAPGDPNTDLSDTWYNFFSYVPYNQYKSELGHLYGIKKVRFYSSGCFRVYTKQPGEATYTLRSKSSGNAACGQTGGSTTDDGWVYYSSEKVFTIFDSLSDYENVDGLKPLLQTFATRPTITNEPAFKFNGQVNDFRHVY
jgi:hypothetical protein